MNFNLEMLASGFRQTDENIDLDSERMLFHLDFSAEHKILEEYAQQLEFVWARTFIVLTLLT